MQKKIGEVSKDFFKFPSTPHLAVLGDNIIRDDKLMSEQERNDFLQHELVVEEKMDGANLGISFDCLGNLRAQNRGAYLHAPYLGQWKKLTEWLTPKTDLFFDLLKEQYILFGEWCYAQHSIPYDRLPDWFLGFDLFDKKSKFFLSCQRRDAMFYDLGISSVPLLQRGHFSLQALTRLLSKSQVSDSPAEGLYLRFDDRDWLGQRAKLVCPEFIQADEDHWSHKGITPNWLRQAQAVWV